MSIAADLAFWAAGAAIGQGLLGQTRRILKRRVLLTPEHWLVKGEWARPVWAFITGFGYWGIYFALGLTPKAVIAAYIFSLALILSVTDLLIRKIPNGVLLALLLPALCLMLWNPPFSVPVWDRLAGLAAAIGIFLVPFLFKTSAGAGDLKYAAVMGLFLGLYGALTAFCIMSASYLCYVVYLFVSKKGNLNTKTALGPYMSLGFVLAFLLGGAQ